MSRRTTLPFPRGSTLMGWASSVSTSDVAGHLSLIGERFEVEDELWGLGPVELTVVQANAAIAPAAAWTTAVTPPITFSSPIVSRGWLARPQSVRAWSVVGRQLSALAPAATGERVGMIDDYYAWKGRTGSIAANDLFYVVSKGPCLSLAEGTTAFDGGDLVAGCASGTQAYAVIEPASGSPNMRIIGAIYGTVGSDAYQTLDSKNFVLVLVDHFAGYHGGSL